MRADRDRLRGKDAGRDGLRRADGQDRRAGSTDLELTTTCGTNSHCEEGTTARCVCDTGYAGGDGGVCRNADDCASNPCGTGNTCTDALSDYTCTCGNNAWQRDEKTCVSRFDRVSAGGNRTCAIGRDRTVACWGEGMEGDNSRPQTIAGLTNVTQISVGADHACALREGGSVSCWGRNNRGQLGNDNRTDSLRTPVAVANFNNVQQISAGAGFTCAIALTGVFGNRRAFCWGDNGSGQLGIGNNNADATTPQQVSGNNNVQQIRPARVTPARATATPCAAGAATITGSSATTLPPVIVLNSPVSVAGTLNNLAEVVAGNDFTCIRRDILVDCWGAPIDGSTGTDVLEPPASPISGFDDISQLSAGAGGHHVCARRSGSSGNVVCWGSDTDGQLGNGDDGSSATPVAISGSVTNVREVSAAR